jgi:hypothetical protein
MPPAILNREIAVPPGFAERSCSLVKYRLPLLAHCYVLCHQPSSTEEVHEPALLMAFFISQAERLARESVGDPRAFLLIHNWATICQRPNWHVHVFVMRKPWQKSSVYVGLKNIALASIHALFGAPAADARPSDIPAISESGFPPNS